MKRNQWVCTAFGIVCSVVADRSGLPAWLTVLIIAAVAGAVAFYNWITGSGTVHPDYVASVLALTVGAAVMLAMGWGAVHALTIGLALAVTMSLLVRWRLGRSAR